MDSRERNLEECRKSYWWYKEHGICTKCGHKDAAIGFTKCEECLYKEIMHKRKKYKELTQEQKDEIYRKNNEKHKRFESQGLCKKCGRKLTDKRFKLCLECRLYMRRYRKEHYSGLKWKESGLCWHCGSKELVEGKTLCPSCYEKQVKISMKNLEKAHEKNNTFRRLNDAFWKERKANKEQRAGT